MGDSLGLVSPSEAVSRLHLQEGPLLYLGEPETGDYRLTAHDPELESQLEAAEEGLSRYRNTLRALAE
jgi:hypothetical protein